MNKLAEFLVSLGEKIAKAFRAYRQPPKKHNKKVIDLHHERKRKRAQ